jgi:predicted nuclease of predicted toxin-antitoxin system
VITKDSDFYDSKLLRGKPEKLIIVLTGNINNESLINLFGIHMGKISELLIDNDIIEIEKDFIIAKKKADCKLSTNYT